MKYKTKIDPETYILINHHRVIATLFNMEPDVLDPKPLQFLLSLMERKDIIETPQELYDKHLIRSPICATKALDLSFNTRSDSDFPNLPIYNTTFEDPKMFYHYPDINVIISPLPVKSFQVSTKDVEQPKAWSVGRKWAIFSDESTYHLHKKSLKIKGFFFGPKPWKSR